MRRESKASYEDVNLLIRWDAQKYYTDEIYMLQVARLAHDVRFCLQLYPIL